MTETIVAAAIQLPTPEPFASETHKGKSVYPAMLTVTAPPPARHANLLHPTVTITAEHGWARHQGFITSTGRFVDREEGLKIALASEQPMIDHPSRNSTMLFSEDLW